MSIRKRIWRKGRAGGETWVCVDYVDQRWQKRRPKDVRGHKTLTVLISRPETKSGPVFIRRQVARALLLPMRANAGSASKSAGLERTTIDAYRSHVDLHSNHFSAAANFQQLTIPIVSEFERNLKRRHSISEAPLRRNGQACARRSRRLALECSGGRSGRAKCRTRNAFKPKARKGTPGRASRESPN